MSARLRPLNWRTDRVAVMSFQKEIYETNFPGFQITPTFLRDYEYQLKQATRSPAERMLVLEDDEGICGFIWMALVTTMVDPLVGYIKNIYVAPRLRNQGWGQQLLAAADEWFQGHGCPRAALDASVCNQHAVRTYLKWGYEPARYRMEKLYLAAPTHAAKTGDPQ